MGGPIFGVGWPMYGWHVDLEVLQIVCEREEPLFAIHMKSLAADKLKVSENFVLSQAGQPGSALSVWIVAVPSGDFLDDVVQLFLELSAILVRNVRAVVNYLLVD